MLGVLRRNKNNPLIVVVLGLVAVLMMAFGISVNGLSSEGNAATVNGEPVTDQAFASLYAQVYRNKQYQNRRYDRVAAEADKLRQTVLDQMIASKILAQEAEARGLAVDDEALRDSILKNEAFFANGVFSRQEYERRVNGSGLSERDFEAAERERLLGQAYAGLVDSMGVSEGELKDSFEWDNTKVDINFVEVPKAEFSATAADVTDADIEAFKAQADAEDKIAAYYKRNKTKKYDVPKKVCAQHILVRADDSTPPDILAEQKKKLENAGRAVAGGMAFSEAAKKFSEDANSQKGGDLGCFGEGETQPQLAQAAFGLEVGKVSNIVQTPFGFHLVKVNEIKEPVRKKLEEVKDEIVRELAKDGKAGKVAKAKADELAALAKTKASLQEAVEELKASVSFELKVDETGPFPSGREFLPKLGLAKDVAKAAWTLTEAAPVAGPIETDRSWVVIRFKGKEAPKDEDYESQRLGIAYRMIVSKQTALREKWYGMLKDREKVTVDPIAIRYDEEAENIRSQRRQRSR